MTPGTRLVSITNPNNPTGSLLTNVQLQAVADAAEAAGAWLHVDEVYRGSELNPEHARTAWGLATRTIVVGSLSKAYALSGLRVGWVVAPRTLIAELWRRHEYAAISTASLSMFLAERALTEPLRQRLLQRQRDLVRAGLSTIANGAKLRDVQDLLGHSKLEITSAIYTSSAPQRLRAAVDRLSWLADGSAEYIESLPAPALLPLAPACVDRVQKAGM